MKNLVKSVGDHWELAEWQLKEDLGNGFEDFIFDTVSEYLAPLNSKGVRVFPTPHVNDGGKDIIIESPIDLDGLFNQKYYRNGKERITIYIECKSSNNGKIRLEKALGNIARVKEHKIDYFILVTNTTITPYAYYKIYSELSLNNISFSLVDQYVLLQFLKKCNRSIGNIVETNYNPKFRAEYQSYEGREDGNKTYDLYILCRSYQEDEHLSSIKLLTDRNWDTADNEVNFVISPYGCYIRKLTIKRAYSDGIDDILFKLKIGKHETNMHIQSGDMVSMFETPFIGKKHKQCVRYFVDLIKNTTGLSINYIWGEAGIGKTRLINEIYKHLNGTKYDFGFFKANSKNFIAKIKDFFVKKHYITKIDTQQTIQQLFGECRHEYRRAVIFIDDIHNIDKNFLDEIKSMPLYNVPLTVVLCGRTDYSAGNADFFSFVQWCIETSYVKGYTLEPLESHETENLISRIIEGIPPVVKARICSYSKNNPLFIVQFIEYLLETDLVKLVNRNTVGIMNVSTFCSKLYIPQEIHSIYEHRLENLKNTTDGTKMVNFLFILSFLGGSMDFSDSIRIFNEDMSFLSQLIKRSFIKISENGDVNLIHESLYLFLEKQLKNNKKWQKNTASLLLERFGFLTKHLTNNDMGLLYVWKSNPDEAKKYFGNSLFKLNNIDNYSNIEIDEDVYDYLYTIYDLFKDNKTYSTLLKNIIMVRIYITLHYKAPANAITECDFALDKMSKTNIISDDTALYYTILEQKAHSMFHAGFLIDGELILKRIQAKWLLGKSTFESGTIFDMMDRLSGVYIKYNIFELAESYNVLSFDIARQKHDNKLLAIALLTQSKLYFYADPEKSKNALIDLNSLLQETPSARIKCSADISELMFDMIHNPECDWISCRSEAFRLLEIAITNSYTASIIRAYMVLAVCAYKTEYSPTLDETRKFISQGIDSSIRFGISTYIWQFYNLLGIVETDLGFDPDHIYKTFTTAFAMLNKQNLLYIGDLNFCYGNILTISNYGFFLQSTRFETEFYKKMSLITYKNKLSQCDYDCEKKECGYFCSGSAECMKNEYQKAINKKALFIEEYDRYLLRDKKNNYYIVLS